MTDENQQSPFDERTALEELERLQHEIQQSRHRREQKAAEFDSFVRSFRKPDVASTPPPASPLIDSAAWAGIPQPAAASSAQPPIAAPESRVGPPEPRVAALESRSAAPGPGAAVPDPPAPSLQPGAPAPTPAFGPESAGISTAPSRYVSASDPAPFGKIPDEIWPQTVDHPNRGRWLLPAAVVGTAAILLAGLLLVRPWNSPASEASGAAPVPQSVTGAAPPFPVVPPAPAADPIPSRAVRLELTTNRPVWLRAVVDGERTIERTLPAGERIPLEADHAIVIRVGDGGALQVTVAGRDTEAFGPDAQPVTRTFAATSR